MPDLTLVRSPSNSNWSRRREATTRAAAQLQALGCSTGGAQWGRARRRSTLTQQREPSGDSKEHRPKSRDRWDALSVSAVAGMLALLASLTKLLGVESALTGEVGKWLLPIVAALVSAATGYYFGRKEER